LAAFKVVWDREREAALNEITRISQEAGMYDPDFVRKQLADFRRE
jgi:hypothetical protein